MRLAVVMVGLPATGKTFAARNVARHLRWLGVPTRLFSVAAYRRALVGGDVLAAFFDPANAANLALRTATADAALAELLAWLGADGHASALGSGHASAFGSGRASAYDAHRVAVLDASNTRAERRRVILDACAGAGVAVLFVECAWSTLRAMEPPRARALRLAAPEYAAMSRGAALADHAARIAYYIPHYVPLAADAYVAARRAMRITLVDGGRRVVAADVRGFLPARALFFLMNARGVPKLILLAELPDDGGDLEAYAMRLHRTLSFLCCPPSAEGHADSEGGGSQATGLTANTELGIAGCSQRPGPLSQPGNDIADMAGCSQQKEALGQTGNEELETAGHNEQHQSLRRAGNDNRDMAERELEECCECSGQGAADSCDTARSTLAPDRSPASESSSSNSNGASPRSPVSVASAEGVESDRRPFVVWTETSAACDVLQRVFRGHALQAKPQLRALDAGHARRPPTPGELSALRADAMRARPGGPGDESYGELAVRVEGALAELERAATDVLVVAHASVLRVLYAYYGSDPPHGAGAGGVSGAAAGESVGQPPDSTPDGPADRSVGDALLRMLPFPRAVVVRLEPRAYGVAERRIPLAE